jgi:hypothetical protein
VYWAIQRARASQPEIIETAAEAVRI